MVLLALFLLAEPTAVRAARLFDARKGALVEPGLVVVEGERIVQVGGTAPGGAKTIDLGDATLLPGLMDAHTHLTVESGPSWYRDSLDQILRWPAEQAQYAAEYARRTLEAGFTAVRDLGASDFIDIGLKKAIDAGAVPGPRMVTAIHAVGSRGGHADLDPYPADRVPPLGIPEGICDAPEACRSAVRWQVKYGAGVIKLVASGGILSLADPVDNVQLSQAELDAIVDEAHRWGRKAAAHCHGDAAAKMLIRAGVDSIEHGTFLKPDTLQEMKKRGVVLMPGPMYDPKGPAADWEKKYPKPILEKALAAAKAWPEMIRNAHRIGVRIAFGSDAGVDTHGKTNPQQLAWLVHWGFTPAAALQSATLIDAELLGIDAGVLEKGKLADVIAVPANPLQDIATVERVSFVMKGGVVVKNGTPAPPPKKLALKAAHLFDAESGTLIDGATVLIENDRIAAAGRNVQVPADARTVDLGDATLLPGLIDAHVHLTGESQEDFTKGAIESLF
ncbi:MAG TPA: amidohydrolase family protein, partial [Myxococcales bacterium]|nr:amidohydrolase family protein [Myxococcales bacterium]